VVGLGVIMQPNLASSLLRKRVRALARHLSGALAAEAEPVHEVRVASRRLRAMLPILARKAKGRRVRRVARTLQLLVRVAGRVRDLDVGVALFDEHLARRGSASADTALLRGRLLAARGRARRRMRQDLGSLDLAGLQSDLRSILSRGPRSPRAVVRRLARAVGRAGAALMRSIVGVADRFDPPTLHAVRRQVRRLHYITDVAADVRRESSDAMRRLKLVQETLGVIHDSWVLAGWLGLQAASARRQGRSSLESAATTLREELVDLARGLHRAYLLAGPADAVRTALHAVSLGDTAA